MRNMQQRVIMCSVFLVGVLTSSVLAGGRRTPASRVDTSTRNNSLRELILARALYRCSDHKGLGEKILKQYARDLRGHYSRHAQAVLADTPASKRK